MNARVRLLRSWARQKPETEARERDRGGKRGCSPLLSSPHSTQPDRSALVTRHRRAPAGRPSAGVQAGGSSDPRGFASKAREGRGSAPAARSPPTLPAACQLRSETETLRLSQWPHRASRRGRRTRPGPERVRGGDADDDTVVSQRPTTPLSVSQ